MKIKTFWADRSGAVASEFTVLLAALTMSAGAALNFSAPAFEQSAVRLSDSIALQACSKTRNVDLSAGSSLAARRCAR